MQTLVLCPGCQADNRVDDGRAGSSTPVCGRCKAALDMEAIGHPVVATDASFQQDVLQSDKPVVVDFWADWCGPCKAFAPTLEQFARQAAGKVRVVKVNVDAARTTATRYGIQSIPTLVLFMGGREVARQSGALPLDQLLRFVSQHRVSV